MEWVTGRAGKSPTFWTHGLAYLGASQLYNGSSAHIASPGESFEVDLDSRVQLRPTSPWTRESQLTALVTGCNCS